jgi:hypothetical protein
MRALRLISSSAIGAVVALTGLQSPAFADDPPVTVTGGDVSGPGDEMPPDVVAKSYAKMRLAEAYVAYKAARGSGPEATTSDAKSPEEAEDAYEAARAAYVAAYPYGLPTRPESSAKSGKSAAIASPAVASSSHVLALQQFSQNTNTYCGPASGKMIAKYLVLGTSAYNGVHQDQEHMAGAAHMRTKQHGATKWIYGDFPRGMNRWWQGQTNGVYVQMDSPSVAEFKNALTLDVDYGIPFAVDTVEWAQSWVRYNDHPGNTPKNIGHWIVVHGYYNWGNTTRFADPSTSLWSGPSAHFEAPTTDFVNTFVQTNGMAW